MSKCIPIFRLGIRYGQLQAVDVDSFKKLVNSQPKGSFREDLVIVYNQCDDEDNDHDCILGIAGSGERQRG